VLLGLAGLVLFYFLRSLRAAHPNIKKEFKT
jgi:hypothetical protein